MLKKLVIAIIICSILLIPNINLAYQKLITIEYEDKPISYKYNQSSVVSGKPLISMDLMFEKYNVTSFEEIQGNQIKFTNEEDNIRFRIGSKYIHVNNKIVKLENRIIKINGQIMLPIDFITEVFKAKASWDKENRVIRLYKDNKLKIHFIDISKGWAAFIDYKDYDILINCGGKDDGEIIANYLKMINTDNIEVMISTQGKSEYIDGMKAVMKNFDIDKYISTGTVIESKALKDSITLMPSNNVLKTFENKDSLIDLGNGVLLNIYVINNHYDSIKSIGVMLENNDFKILFLEDTNLKVVMKNIDTLTDLDVISTKNQLDNTIQNNKFLDITKPEIIINLSSKNELDNPVEENSKISSPKDLTNELNDSDIKVYDTQDIGSIVITTDGYKYEINTILISGIFIKQIDFINKHITLYNHSYKDHDLSNCIVTDKKGEKVYYIKEGSIIESGYQRIFKLIEANGDEKLQENEERVFRKDFISDKGILYDSNWNILSKYPSRLQ